MPLATFDPYRVVDIRALKTYSRSDEAYKLLEKVADQVQPIMRERWLKVPLLTEFFPNNARLQGLNVGGGGSSTREIKLRLRPASNCDSFLPYTYVLGTMLHELCHNTISPHNADFYALLAKLTTECEDLMNRGVHGSGQGFDAPSAGRIGGRWRNPSAVDARTAGLKAAEQRSEANKRRLAMAPAGPQLLGGSLKLMTPAQAAAWAAEKRAQDQTACGNDDEHGTQVDYDDRTNEVTILDDEPTPRKPSSSNAAPRKQSRRRREDHTSSVVDLSAVIDLTVSDDEFELPSRTAMQSVPSRKRTSRSSKDKAWEWTCLRCTFKNAPWLETCTVCESKR